VDGVGPVVPPPLPNQFDKGSWWPLGLLAASIIGIVAGTYVYGIPLATRVLLAAVPLSVDRAIGDLFFESMNDAALTPTRLAAPEQARLRAAFSRAVQRADGGSAWDTTLEFRSGDIGPNAFALPGGRIVITDELVSLVGAREDVVVGVLAHEYGHVKARHGVRMVAQSALLRTVTGLLLGDFSAVLAAAPALLGEQAYSRDFERDADAESVRVMKAAGLSPAAMVAFFEKLAEKKLGSESGIAIAFASHPADAERVDFFRRAAGAQSR
jgi:Zn-dependent protease with chaperone function